MRHADPVTIDHIIDLRKRIATLEHEIKILQRENERILAAIKRLADHNQLEHLK